MQTSMRGSRYVFLDAVRGFSILWIVVFHLLNQHLSSYPPLAALFIKNGHLGVPIFFLASGFAVSTSAAKVLAGLDSPGRFIMNRLSRIYLPLFYSLLFAGFLIPALTWVLYHFSGYSTEGLFFSYSWPEWLGLFSLLKIFAPATGDLNRSFLPINGALWFVAVLVQMYFVVYLALLKRQFYSIVIGVMTAVWLLVTVFQAEQSLPRGLFLPSWGPFVAGIGLYYLLNLGKIFVRIFIGLACAVLLAFHFSSFTFSLFTAAGLWVLYPYDGFLARMRTVRFFIFINTFSYSVYLMHIPLDDLVSTLIGFISPFPAQWTDMFLIVPAIVALSWLWSLAFEARSGIWNRLFERAGERWFPRRVTN